MRNLQYLPRTSKERETLFEDRTNAHADHVGAGFDRHTTAAVGLLKVKEEEEEEEEEEKEKKQEGKDE